MTDGSLRVTLVQEASSTEAGANLATLGRLGAAGAFQDTDLVVLPEAFQRDFGNPGGSLAPYAEPLDGPFASALTELATTHGVHVLGGMFEQRPDDLPFNTLVLAAPGGDRVTYRKHYLYDSFGYRESDALSPGDDAPVTLTLNGLRLGLMTCYDLRFPEWARAMAGVDALIVPAAWVAGEGKVEHWRTLLRARAIENVCYCVGVGQPGPRYTGHSLVADPMGVVEVQAGTDAAVVRATLRSDVVEESRRRNPSLENRRT